jgi:hypothetical protein
VGVSISQEFGYQRAQFSADTWTYELRPIIDKQVGRWYFAFNPAFDKSFHGPSVSQGFIFSPDAKVSYDFTKKIAGGIEYTEFWVRHKTCIVPPNNSITEEQHPGGEG